MTINDHEEYGNICSSIPKNRGKNRKNGCFFRTLRNSWRHSANLAWLNLEKNYVVTSGIR